MAWIILPLTIVGAIYPPQTQYLRGILIFLRYSYEAQELHP